MDVFEALILALLLYPLVVPALKLPVLRVCTRLGGQVAIWLLLSLVILVSATWMHKVTICPIASAMAWQGYKRDTIKKVLLVLNLLFLAFNILCLHLLRAMAYQAMHFVKTRQHPPLPSSHHHHGDRNRRLEYRIDVAPSKTRSGTIYNNKLCKLVSPRTARRCQRAMSLQFY